MLYVEETQNTKPTAAGDKPAIGEASLLTMSYCQCHFDPSDNHSVYNQGHLQGLMHLIILIRAQSLSGSRSQGTLCRYC